MIDFGDIEPDDVYSPADPDPDQVTYRVHELRTYLDTLAGPHAVRWEDLSADERRLALAIGVVIVEFLIEVDPDIPEDAARNLHNVRRYWSGGALPEWDDVPEDERAVGIELMRQIIEWLRREGTLPTRTAA